MATPRSRTSDAPVELRASVLDAALTLGIRNSVVAKWMFDPIQESEDGDELSPNPGLTSPSSSGSTASHSTTDDSSMAPFHFRFPGRFGAPLPDPKLGKIHEQPLVIEAEKQAPEAVSVDHSSFLPVSQSTDDGHSISSFTKDRKKLRKAQKSGYESDKGYISEGGRKSKDSTKRKKNKGDDINYESDGGYLSEVVSSKKSKKSKSKPKKASKDTDEMSPITDPEAFLASVQATLNVPISHSEGYVTDSAANTTPSKRGRSKSKKEKGSRTRPASPLPGTDASSPASGVPDTPSKKNRLLRMMTRSASRDREKDKDKTKQADEAPPPVPPLPISLPIAEKFARTGPFPTSNAVSPSSSGTYAGISPVTPDLSRPTSADISSPSSGEDETSLTASPIALANANPLSPDVWTNDVLIAGGAKAAQVPQALIETFQRSRDDETLVQPITKVGSRELEVPIERAKSPTPLRSLSPVFSGPINALLSTPERRRKKKQNANSPSSSVSSTATGSSSNSTGSSRPPLKLSTSAISEPNPHLTQRLRPPPSPLELASRMRSDSPAQGVQFGLPPSPAKLSPGYLRLTTSPSSEAMRTPDSYVFVEKEDGQSMGRKIAERQSAFSVVPSSDYIVPSPLPSPLPPALAERRSVNVAPLLPTRPLNITPKGSRSNTPVPASPGASQEGGLSVPNTPTARASIIAYYQIPPPSPPPTGPLPRVPSDGETPRRGSDDRQFLTPAAAARYGSRSPSPLRMTSRPTSPSGLFSQAIPPVRRGRESPFPTRPILPAEDRSMLVRRPSATPQTLRPDAPLGVTRAVSPDLLEARMRRFKNAYATPYQEDSAEGDDLENDVYSSSEDFHEDTRSSAYIRQARARGEKRVYFSDVTTSASEEDADVHLAIHALRKNISIQEEYDEDVSPYTREDEDGSYDRHSIASMSVYSRYSVLDADRSAALREGFVKRIEALYGTEDIPAVPEIPATLRVAAPGMGTRNASSPSRF